MVSAEAAGDVAADKALKTGTNVTRSSSRGWVVHSCEAQPSGPLAPGHKMTGHHLGDPRGLRHRQHPGLGIAELLTELAIDADKVTGPVLWLHGEEDQLVPMAGTRRGIALLRNANVTEKTYPGARHEIFNELNKDEVLADTTAFLGKVTDG